MSKNYRLRAELCHEVGEITRVAKKLNRMTKSFLFPEINLECAFRTPLNGLRRCFSPGSFAVFGWELDVPYLYDREIKEQAIDATF